MEFISRLLSAFFSLFFGDVPFPEDDHIIVQEQVAQNSPISPASSLIEESIQVTPEFEKWWCPSLTSTPKPRRLFFDPESDDEVIPQVKVSVGIQLPLNNYLRSLEVGGRKTLYQAPTAMPVKRMGLRV
jgi:hypothetical protein